MKEDILKILQDAIEELNEQLDDEEKIEYSDETHFVGSTACLSSINFVTLVTIIEELIEDQFNKTIHLVNEKAFSEKRSPFYSIETIAEYIETLLKEED